MKAETQQKAILAVAASVAGQAVPGLGYRLMDLLSVLSVEQLPSRVRPTWVAIAHHANEQGWTRLWNATIGEMIGRSRRTVMRHKAELERLLFIQRQARKADDGRTNLATDVRLGVYDGELLRKLCTREGPEPCEGAAGFAPAGASVPPATAAPAPVESSSPVRAPVVAPAPVEPPSPVRMTVGASPAAADVGRVLAVLEAEERLRAIATEEMARALLELAEGERFAAPLDAVLRALEELRGKILPRVTLSRQNAWRTVSAFVQACRVPRKEAGPAEPVEARRARRAEERRAEERRASAAFEADAVKRRAAAHLAGRAPP